MTQELKRTIANIDSVATLLLMLADSGEFQEVRPSEAIRQ